MKIILKIISIFLHLAFALFSLFILFNLSLLFGRTILEGVLVGNDSAYAISLISWFERFYPQVPLWYPLQGAGVSLFHSYPMLTSYLSIFLKQVTNLNSVEVYRVLSFAAFPLTAFGVYVLALRKIKNPVAALFAGVFFLLNQASWIFQRLHGIFAQSFSMVFVPWVFIFFDIFLEYKLKQKRADFLTRSSLVLTIIFFAISFLAHPVTGMVVALSLLVYAFFYSQALLGLKVQIKKRAKNLAHSLFLTTITLALAVSLVGFWLIPFNSYNNLANRDGLLEMNIGQLEEVSLKLETLFGFGDFRTGDLRYDYFFFALPVILLAIIGLLGAGLSNASVFSWVLVAFGAIFYTSLPLYIPLYIPGIVNYFKFIFTAVYFRALIASIVLLPVGAAFGAYFMANFPFFLGSLAFAKKLKKYKSNSFSVFKYGFGIIRFFTISLLILLLGIFFIGSFEHKPPDRATKEHSAYGIQSFKAYGPTLEQEDMDILKKDISVLWQRPNIKLNPKGLDPAPSLLGFIRDFKLDNKSRVDVSSFSGQSFLLYAPMYTDAGFVNLYHYSASLIHRMWGYQQGVFYGSEPLFDNPELLKELSYWFGIEYTTIVPGYDRIDNYKKVGWELAKEVNGLENPLPIYKFPDADGMLVTSNRPVALVIGSVKDAAYDQVFKASNAGAFSYQNLWLVEGDERLDNYSLDELKQFAMLILHGYSYQNKRKAWGLINAYVKSGGKVFIDTGWQYVAKDWGRSTGKLALPEPAPVSQTSWEEASAQWPDYTIDSALGKHKTTTFKPFLWEGNAWGAAIADESAIRPDTKVLMKDKNGIVVAMRDYGEGRIIWSGLNLISHAQGPEGEKEIGVVKAVFDLLLAENKAGKVNKVSWDRDFPDMVNIKLSGDLGGQWLLWREAYSPNWHVYLGEEELQTHRAGPGFLLTRIPESLSQTDLRLEYKLNFFDGVLAKLISIITIIILFVYLIIGQVIEKFFAKLWKKFGRKYKKKVSSSLVGNEEEDY